MDKENYMQIQSESIRSQQARLGEILKKSPVIPVLVLDDVMQAVALAEALVAGGLQVLEVTLRTAQALACVEAIRERCPQAVVGVGTVLNAAQFEAAQRVGAQFAVSPGLTHALIASAAAAEMPLLPGVHTASEVMFAQASGFDYLKFFPAIPAGGVAMLKSFAGPFAQAKFCPTGGVTPALASELLALPNVMCVGGSWLSPSNLLAAADWSAIRRLAEQAAALRAST